uniref:Uncharacterized protein n=1 Tax=Sphaerodactylus townsendi TaxID=933632 RepID=A0ACB8FHI0_9SAUR
MEPALAAATEEVVGSEREEAPPVVYTMENKPIVTWQRRTLRPGVSGCEAKPADLIAGVSSGGRVKYSQSSGVWSKILDSPPLLVGLFALKK